MSQIISPYPGLKFRHWVSGCLDTYAGGIVIDWAVTVAFIAGALGLAPGWGYLVIGFFYSGIWVAGVIVRGSREEEVDG